jgi:hypothetical protein
MPADSPARENFSRYFLQRSAEYIFVSSVPFTDEAYFGTENIIIIHNQHQWAEENLYGVMYSRHQQHFSINVRVGIGDCLVGPHVFLHRLTTEIASYMICQSYWKVCHWQSEHECGTCIMVLRHI